MPQQAEIQTVKPATPYSLASCDLDDTVDRLGRMVRELQSRLEAVRKPIPIAPPPAPQMPTPPAAPAPWTTPALVNSPVVTALKAHNTRLNKVCDELLALTNDLDI